jgi:membrane associated rhomboid family serine protease
VGIYDRDYIRQPERPGFSPHLPQSIVGTLIVINVAVWLADAFTPEIVVNGHVVGRWLSSHLAASAGTLSQPWFWWQFLTAGFTHSPAGVGPGIWHILGNMFALFVFGRDIENRYGPREFLRVYLAMLVFANVAWCIITRMTVGVESAGLYGASGAIAGVVVLYAFNFPHATFLLFFVIPIPAWLLGMGIVAYDMFGAMGGIAGSHVAYSAHVAGAAFALLYYQRGWNLTRWSEGLFRWPTSLFRPKPRLHIHKPPDEEPPPDNLTAEVDRILEKIYREGEASLTSKERSTLETASRKYQERREK